MMKKGFTLLELLVAIGVLAVLSSITIYNFSGANASARDGKRRGEIKQYQTAVETYASKNNGAYPIRVGVTEAYTMCGAGQPFGNVTCPNDPRRSNGWDSYGYISDASGTRYIVWAHLEKATPPFSVTYFVACSNGTTGLYNLNGAWNAGSSAGNCPI